MALMVRELPSASMEIMKIEIFRHDPAVDRGSRFDPITLTSSTLFTSRVLFTPLLPREFIIETKVFITVVLRVPLDRSTPCNGSHIRLTYDCFPRG